MDGVIMNGKVLKVKEYNLEFGSKDRFVNILGCFKYKPNGNVYVIYSDVDTKYNIIWYGSAHVKENIILCMQCRDKSEEEVIKEYVFKVAQNQAMDNFEMISLDEIESIEIIASSKVDIKPEVLNLLVDKLIPKPEVEKEEEKVVVSAKRVKKRNTGPLKILLIFLIMALIGVSVCYFMFKDSSEESVERSIVCNKEYRHGELAATVDEVNTYNFNIKDSLESIDTVLTYQFEEEDYQDFILRGAYYKYMPDDNVQGGWDKDDEEFIFKVITKVYVDTSYNKPTNYEEVLSYYKSEGYTCSEKIESE